MSVEDKTRPRHTLTRKERLRGEKTIERLFNGSGSRAMAAFPLRLVCMAAERKEGEATAQMMVCVPKRRLHDAVDRNRVKRQVREAYRLNKHILRGDGSTKTLMAFVYIDDKPHESSVISASVARLLQRQSERIMGTNPHSRHNSTHKKR